jgi:hypothetical protein
MGVGVLRNRRPVQGCIGCDNTVKSLVTNLPSNLLNLGVVKIGRNLQKQGDCFLKAQNQLPLRVF